MRAAPSIGTIPVIPPISSGISMSQYPVTYPIHNQLPPPVTSYQPIYGQHQHSMTGHPMYGDQSINYGIEPRGMITTNKRQMDDSYALSTNNRNLRARADGSNMDFGNQEGMVVAEMNNLLRAMLAEIGGSITLNELYTDNPNLYRQIRTQAEAAIRNNSKIFSGTNSQKSNITPSLVPTLEGLAPLFPSSGTLQTSLAYSSTGSHNFPPLINVNSNRPLPTKVIHGFICEHPAVVDLDRANNLLNSLDSMTAMGDNSKYTTLAKACLKTSAQLKMYLNHSGNYSLPAILFGPIPLEPSKEFLRRIQVDTSSNKITPAIGVQKIPVPIFR